MLSCRYISGNCLLYLIRLLVCYLLQVLGVPCPLEGEGPACTSGKRKGRCKLATSCKGEYTTKGCPGPSPIACCLGNELVYYTFLIVSLAILITVTHLFHILTTKCRVVSEISFGKVLQTVVVVPLLFHLTQPARQAMKNA